MRKLFLLLITCISIRGFAASAVMTGLRIKSDSIKTQLIFYLNKKTTGQIKHTAPSVANIEFENTIKKFKISNRKLYLPNIHQLWVKTKKNKIILILQLVGEVKIQAKFLNNVAPNVILEITISPKEKIKIVENKQPTKKFLPPNKNLTIKKTTFNEILNTSNVQKIITTQTLIDQELQRQHQGLKYYKSMTKTKTIIVIDAGHGGKDSGARGKEGALEKDVVLRIAKKLAKKINQSGNMLARLTRDKDVFVPLRERLKLARKGDADIFIAIHADGYYEENASGASVYALSQLGATSEAARWLAQNDRYDEIGDVQFSSLPDQSKMIRSVLIDLAQTATIRESLDLGQKILMSLDDISNLHYKRVEQAPFIVLKSPDIPSVLIETGFITNRTEEKLLSSFSYQNKMVEAIYQGIKQYVDANENNLS